MALNHEEVAERLIKILSENEHLRQENKRLMQENEHLELQNHQAQKENDELKQQNERSNSNIEFRQNENKNLIKSSNKKAQSVSCCLELLKNVAYQLQFWEYLHHKWNSTAFIVRQPNIAEYTTVKSTEIFEFLHTNEESKYTDKVPEFNVIEGLVHENKELQQTIATMKEAKTKKTTVTKQTFTELQTEISCKPKSYSIEENNAKCKNTAKKTSLSAARVLKTDDNSDTNYISDDEEQEALDEFDDEFFDEEAKEVIRKSKNKIELLNSKVKEKNQTIRKFMTKFLRNTFVTSHKAANIYKSFELYFFEAQSIYLVRLISNHDYHSTIMIEVSMEIATLISQINDSIIKRIRTDEAKKIYYEPWQTQHIHLVFNNSNGEIRMLFETYYNFYGFILLKNVFDNYEKLEDKIMALKNRIEQERSMTHL